MNDHPTLDAPDEKRIGTHKICSIADCTSKVKTRGWCSKHYTRWQRHGDPLGYKFDTPTTERFMEKVDATVDGCWLWQAHGDAGGYGRFKFQGRDKLAHVVAYTLFVGPVPDGLQVDHTCHNDSDCEGGISCPHRRCVNPAHLEAVTPQQNSLRGRTLAATYAARTHCDRNHELSGENVRASRKGRICRACYRERYSESRAKQGAV